MKQQQPTTPAQQMSCMEVWGGSQLTTRGVEMGGLDAWVYSKPFGNAQRGGDVYYASSCATGRITRLLLADVSGHGNAVASTAANLRTLMRRFVNRLDQTEFVRLLNQPVYRAFRSGHFRHGRRGHIFRSYAAADRLQRGPSTAAVIPGRQSRNGLCWAPRPRTQAVHPNNMPLGIIDVTEYEQFDVELEAGDCVLSYTDALIESRDADGEMLGEVGLVAHRAALLGEWSRRF